MAWSLEQCSEPSLSFGDEPFTNICLLIGCLRRSVSCLDLTLVDVTRRVRVGREPGVRHLH
jgi:hypothetical protein